MAVTRNLLIAVGLTCFLCGPVQANFDCQLFGDDTSIWLEPDYDCTIHHRPASVNQYPDVEFVDKVPPGDPDPVCFIGHLSGTLGDVRVKGRSISGLTNNEFPDFLLTPEGDQLVLRTAATVLKLRKEEGNVFLGRLFLRDTFFFSLLTGEDNEQLVVIDGTRNYAGAKGTIIVTGNPFPAPGQGTEPEGATVSGKICLEN